MKLSLRIFLAYFVVIAVGVYFLIAMTISEFRPGVRQSTEDTLVEMSNLLAEVVAKDFLAENLHSSNFSESVNRFLERSVSVDIFGVRKDEVKLRVYMTDQQGVVVYDSAGLARGEDYSQWNDVYLTLKGEYGVRSTLDDPNNPLSSVMHVAAPIKDGEHIIGVLTVAKPNLSVQPFIELAKSNVRSAGILLVLAALLIGLALSYWLTASIRKLVDYANDIAAGIKVSRPVVNEPELSQLGGAIAHMRDELEGKEYVEKYVHALTHELKSPVSAIKASAELIDGNMPVEDLDKFTANISHEVNRIDQVINRLLLQASLERKSELEKTESVNLLGLVNDVVQSHQSRIKKQRIEISVDAMASDGEGVDSIEVRVDKFLLVQALDNLLINALEFTPDQGNIVLSVLNGADSVVNLSPKDDQLMQAVSVSILDSGPGIPKYALDRIYDRFYSLPRPSTGKKSTGLGLSFVREVTELHGGVITIRNHKDGGVIAVLSLPIALPGD